VMVTGIDPQGKIRLSRQAVLEGWTAQEAAMHDRMSRSGGSRSGGGRSGGGRSGYNRGGGRGNDRRGGPPNRNRRPPY
jgi:polyribonucleotide nucleotidyltransferase